jgi:hypothetical protein
MNIIRLTRHKASEAQLAELNRLFPRSKVEQVSETLPSNTREAVSRFDEIAKESDVAEVVLPVNLLESIIKFSEFCKSGGIVIRAITNRELDEGGNVTFTFDHYEQVIRVEVVTKRLQPIKGLSKCDDKLLVEMLSKSHDDKILTKEIEKELSNRFGFEVKAEKYRTL